ncbi:MAG: hypothetical protein AAGH64_02250 [Planctomycetota bacterium]
MIRTLSTIAVLAAAGTASAQSLSVLLEIDLSVENQVTFTATDGVSAETITGSSGTGFYLDNSLLGSGSGAFPGSQVGTADLTSAADASDGTPRLFVATNGVDTGLNIWNYSDTGDSSFTAGETALSGSATFSLDAVDYDNFVAEGSSGLIYFPADDIGDLNDAVVIGRWVIVPAPGAGALLAMGGLVAVRRRRA